MIGRASNSLSPVSVVVAMEDPASYSAAGRIFEEFNVQCRHDGHSALAATSSLVKGKNSIYVNSRKMKVERVWKR